MGMETVVSGGGGPLASGGGGGLAPFAPTSSSSAPCRREALLAQARGAASPAEVARAIQGALDAPGVFVFGEFLDLVSVQQLANSEHANVLELLKLFAYGTLRDYKGKESMYPPLNETQLRKLRQLSVASLAARCRSLPYDDLMKEIGLATRRELEDLVIETIYADVVKGKLDQRQGCFHVDRVLARDVPGDLLTSTVSRLLADWCASCEGALRAAEDAAERADDARQRHRQRQAQVDKHADALRQQQQQHSQTPQPTASSAQPDSGAAAVVSTAAAGSSSSSGKTR